MVSLLEYPIEIGPLGISSEKRSILTFRHIEVPVHIAAGAKLDLEFPFRRKISDRSYARGTNWNSSHL
jgi:hypothetical protein